jgi:N-methylhydantoinase A/acetophenone carboxylase
VIDGHVGNQIFKETALRGRDTRDFVIFACGGAGPTHACGFAENVGIRQIYVFPFASVFCAFGSSILDVVHIYERSKHIIIQEAFSGQLLDDFHEFNDTVAELQEKALRDIRSEGFSEQDAFFVLDLEGRYGTQLYFSRFTSPLLYINSEEDIKQVVSSFNRSYGETYDPIGAYPEGGIEIETFILKAAVAMPKYSLKKKNGEASFDAAYKGTRKVCWDSMGYIDTPVYNFNLLGSGCRIEGPAVIEAADTTLVIPQSYTFSMDELGCGLMAKNA